jgi:sulfur-oxidizing protein SoxA
MKNNYTVGAVLILGATLSVPVAAQTTPAKDNAKSTALRTTPHPHGKSKQLSAPVEAAPEKDAATLEFERFRELMEDSNPAELFEMKGEELWNTPRGPKNVALAKTCDLGLGVGVVKGAYVQTPRYYPDADAVMDIERRIAWCMETQQGMKREDLVKRPFSNETQTPELVSLTTYVAAHSKGMTIAIPQQHPKEIAAYRIGTEIFKFRAGPYDFACGTCHGEDGKRIRMQQLPNLSVKRDAMRAYAGWPGYRMTGGVMHTLQWRMNDCFRQQRFPEPAYLSDSVTALLTYLGVNANGNTYKGPGIKR